MDHPREMMTLQEFERLRLEHAFRCFQLADGGLRVLESLAADGDASRELIISTAAGIRASIEELRGPAVSQRVTEKRITEEARKQ
jgi:hypothetical protein